jgi:chloramphenicol 3-O phosphotransferase
MDAFVDMLPARLIGSADGLLFEKIEQNGLPAVAVRSGALAEPVFRGMRRAVAAMADAGNDLVVDDVFWDNELSDYRILLAAHQFKAADRCRALACAGTTGARAWRP